MPDKVIMVKERMILLSIPEAYLESGASGRAGNREQRVHQNGTYDTLQTIVN